MSWVTRFIGRVFERAAGEREQEARVVSVLQRRGTYDSPADFFSDLLAALLDGPEGEELEEASLAHIIRGVRMGYGAVPDGHTDDALELWKTLAQRFPTNAYARAFYGDALLATGQRAEAFTELMTALDLDPQLLQEFGDDVAHIANDLGGHALLQYRIAEVRAQVEMPDDPDEIRELYSELLEDYRDDDVAVEQIRGLGRRINELTEQDLLPRALVMRSPRS